MLYRGAFRQPRPNVTDACTVGILSSGLFLPPITRQSHFLRDTLAEASALTVGRDATLSREVVS